MQANTPATLSSTQPQTAPPEASASHPAVSGTHSHMQFHFVSPTAPRAPQRPRLFILTHSHVPQTQACSGRPGKWVEFVAHNSVRIRHTHTHTHTHTKLINRHTEWNNQRALEQTPCVSHHNRTQTDGVLCEALSTITSTCAPATSASSSHSSHVRWFERGLSFPVYA